MNELKYPTKEQLASTMAIATADKTEQQFIDDYLKGVYEILRADVRQYRSYGVFWWPIKLAFNQRGIFDFGEAVDASCIANMEHLSQAEQLCAAYLNKQAALSRGGLYLCDHVYDGTDGEEYFFTLDDQELELIIAGNI